ncbi:MAG TPA: transcriptional regulator, partial [Candidatus Lokiarchaeia archaeon]
MNKLKRAVIKEELVELTGGYREAIILNQFIYWSERICDFDKFIEEENKRRIENAEIEKTNGWIYKSIKELKTEVMINLSESNFKRYVNVLIEKGFISKRTNPKYKWDK